MASFDFNLRPTDFSGPVRRAQREELELRARRNALADYEAGQRDRTQFENALATGGVNAAARVNPMAAQPLMEQQQAQRAQQLQGVAAKAWGIYTAPSPLQAAQAAGALESMAEEVGKPVQALTDDDVRALARQDAYKAISAGGLDPMQFKEPEIAVPFDQSDTAQRIKAESAAREQLARVEAEQRIRVAREEARLRGGGGGAPSNSVPGVTPKLTEGQGNASGYYLRMKEAEPLIGDFKPGFKDYLAYGRVLTGGGLTGSAANAILSDDAQKYFQAASDWVRAKLRKESGAVIAADEMLAEIRTYFPMPGDSPGVIAQKKKARETAMRAMSVAAGPGAAAVTQPDSGGWSITPVSE